MEGISLSYSNTLHQTKKIDSTSILRPWMKLIVQSTLDEDTRVSLFLLNPFNYIINHFLLSRSSQQSISIHFNDFLPSGRYHIKLLNLANSQAIEHTDSQPNHEIISFQFLGLFSNFSWTVTYAVSCIVKNGMDIRLAAPKQHFPYFLVESLEGRPLNTFTTDLWSNWLLFDTTTKIGTNSIMFGFHSVVHGNYIIFSPESLSGKVQSENSEFIKYLTAENGIECSDPLIKDFAKKITATSVFGIIHQILYLVTNHITFKDQLGEFGAKYALLNRQGDCTEYSALFTALCRIKNIPSRLVAGLKRIASKNQDHWIRHAWSEIYYEGLWIPIDVVEGKSKIIGFHPDIIPLFKGNWMEENNMNRELKISIPDEYQNILSMDELVESYSSLSISYKVNTITQHESDDQKLSDFSSSKQIEIQIDENLKTSSQNTLGLLFDELPQHSVLGIYYKAQTVEQVKSPKMVYCLKQLPEKLVTKTNVTIETPEHPGLYELGIFVCSPYGEIVGVNAIEVRVTE